MCGINSVCDSLEAKSRNQGPPWTERCPAGQNCCRKACFREDCAWKAPGKCVILRAQPMKRSLQVPIAPRRKMAAWVCLLAVMFLWAPLWAMALQANGVGCCADGFCARSAHGHQKTGRAAAGQPAPAETPMECEYHGRAAKDRPDAMRCSMSCGHENSDLLTAAVVFVLPVTAPVSVPLDATSAPIELTASEFMRSIEPVSPPPRITLSAI